MSGKRGKKEEIDGITLHPFYFVAMVQHDHQTVKEIESEAFAFCDALEEVHVSKGIKIDDKAFAFCDKIRIIYAGDEL